MKLKSIFLIASGMLLVSNSFGQTHVNTGTSKYTLVEEATGQWCGYCPDGAQVIEQSIEPYYPHAVIASWHGPLAYSEPMTVANDPYCTGTGWITGFPDGTINRDASWSGGIQQYRANWVSEINTDSVRVPKFEVLMTCTFDSVASTIHVAVTGKALATLTGKWSISALITEDSVSSSPAAYQQHSYLYPAGTTCANGLPSWFIGLCAAACPGYPCSSCAVLPSADYFHMNVVRAVLANNTTSGNNYGFWGDTAFNNPAINTTNTKTYTYVIPSGSNYKMMKVIGLIEKYGGADKSVENVAQAKVKLMSHNTLGINTANTTLQAVDIYPNPAGNNITVSASIANAATSVTITNMVGQVVLEKKYAPNGTYFSENISLANFSNGVYFMTMENGGEKVARKFVVNK